MSYKIGSFNMYKLNFRSDREIKKDFELIARIIRDENFDVVAMQEVFTPHAMEEIVRYLGPKRWRYSWEAPISRTAQSAEGYAFLWRTGTNGLVLNETNDKNGYARKNPRILNEYSCNHNHSKVLIRPPYYASFYTKNCFAEIRIINAHIHFGSNSTIDKERRREEFRLMANNMYERLSQRPDGHNRAIYTIILGDYNLNLRGSCTSGPYMNDAINILYKGREETLLTVQNELTTLKRKEDENFDEDDPNNGYSQNYDHCSYGMNRFSGVNIRALKIDAVKKYTENNFARFKREVSDHVPIVAELELNSRLAFGNNI